MTKPTIAASLRVAPALALALTIALPRTAHAEDVVLYDRDGSATAYIDANDLSVYRWNGEPSAYLQRANDGVFDVFGVNGHHLGWYMAGVLYGNDGSAACAMAERLTYSQPPTARNPRQLLHARGVPDPIPRRPAFDNAFSATPCDTLLSFGAAR